VVAGFAGATDVLAGFAGATDVPVGFEVVSGDSEVHASIIMTSMRSSIAGVEILRMCIILPSLHT
jgi:hypothetical protein